MLKTLSLLILCFQMNAWCYQDPDKNHELYDSLESSFHLSPELKIGLEQTKFWYELHLKYPNADDKIPELREQAVNLAASINNQLRRYYEGEQREARLNRFNEIYVEWINACNGTSPTLRQWYELCIKTSWACSGRPDCSYKDAMLTSADLLTRDGFIIGIIFPAAENPDFNGTVGEATRVAGIATNVWLAGLSVRPDLKVDGREQTPQEFLWHTMYGYGLQYHFTHTTLAEMGYQQVMKINLIENPTNEVYLWHRDWLFEQEIRDPFPMGLDEGAYRELFKKNFTSQ